MSLQDTNSSDSKDLFKSINLPIPVSVYKLPFETQTTIYKYLNQMDDHHKKAYLIAKDHLKTSFNILKSNGYKEWLQKQ
jgi:hypothetical protein